MKKLFTLFISLFFLLSMQTFSFAAEEQPAIPYFGSGANVQDLGTGEFLVKTEGVKKEEGFIFTPKQPFTTDKIKLQVSLKGQGTVIIKISETNARGQFIREESLPVQLTEEWNTYSMPYQLASTTSQIDVSIFTQEKTKTQFSFKDLIIKEE